MRRAQPQQSPSDAAAAEDEDHHFFTDGCEDASVTGAPNSGLPSPTEGFQALVDYVRFHPTDRTLVF